ncbi:unnamed protein product [Lasius platythorax]|uniref:Uncharacterized protein n=1 Tax=Lasius platythorax TaxID=488582 RepID=A0AAV2NK71_9HYME
MARKIGRGFVELPALRVLASPFSVPYSSQPPNVVEFVDRYNRWISLNPARRGAAQYRCLGKQWVTDGQSCKWDGCLLTRPCSTFTENLNQTYSSRARSEKRVFAERKPVHLLSRDHELSNLNLSIAFWFASPLLTRHGLMA